MASLQIKKTYKLYIDGKFPRTESGRYYPLQDKAGKLLANLCLASAKDFRNAVVAARDAFTKWSHVNAFLRGQILYRVAEMLEGRSSQFSSELQSMGMPKTAAEKEVREAVDTFVYYAGWTDKYPQVFSSVNPVASPHFNFSRPEPCGVVAVIASHNNALLSLASSIAPLLAGGNTCVVLASQSMPLSAITLGEVLHASDIPSGVVNLLTGSSEELLTPIATHMDVNALLLCEKQPATERMLGEQASLNLKRLACWHTCAKDPQRIMDFQEIKTTWHPVGI